MTEKIQWNEFLKEQTPENLRTSENSHRAWGYAKFRLGDLLQFAKRQGCTANISAPYINLEKATSSEIDNEDPLEAFTNSGYAEGRSDRSVCDRLLRRLKTSVGEKKAALCTGVAAEFGVIPQGKLAFRYTAPSGANGPVCLIFRITGATIPHETLKNIMQREGVRSVILRLVNTTAIFKVIVRKL